MNLKSEIEKKEGNHDAYFHRINTVDIIEGSRWSTFPKTKYVCDWY